MICRDTYYSVYVFMNIDDYLFDKLEQRTFIPIWKQEKEI